ncbi:hypothetical protein [Paenibacillus lautus]|uniref:hypothetical protein n=1 Tax=Paenibacillus lautus TaxID=1401 RepID=UPI003D2C9B1F
MMGKYLTQASSGLIRKLKIEKELLEALEKKKTSSRGPFDRVVSPRIPRQVGYGETDLSLLAQKYRIENKAFDLRNLVVAEIEIDGVRTLKVFESTKRTVVKPSGKVDEKKCAFRNGSD